MPILYYVYTGIVLVLHYESFTERMGNCPLPIAHGPSGTGKTTALHCGLSLLGVDDLRFYRNLTPSKALQLCATTNMPLGIDDPDTKSNYCKLVMDLFHGAKKATISAGETKPISGMVVTTNFAPIEDQR